MAQEVRSRPQRVKGDLVSDAELAALMVWLWCALCFAAWCALEFVGIAGSLCPYWRENAANPR
jgi:hypothetical protein